MRFTGRLVARLGAHPPCDMKVGREAPATPPKRRAVAPCVVRLDGTAGGSAWQEGSQARGFLVWDPGHVLSTRNCSRRSPRWRRAARPSTTQKNAETGKLFARERIALLRRRGHLRRGRRARQQRSIPSCPPTASSPASAHDRRPHRGHHGQRLDREGRLAGARARSRRSSASRRRRRRCAARSSTWSTRRARASPIRSRCSPAAAARGASSTTRCTLSGQVPQVCLLFGPSRGGRRVHPRVLRRRGDGRRQRQHVPRLAAHGRDGHRREGHARGDGRREDALLRVRLRRRAREDRGGGDRLRQALPRATCRRTAPSAAAGRRGAGAQGRRQDASRRSSPPTRTSPST